MIMAAAGRHVHFLQPWHLLADRLEQIRLHTQPLTDPDLAAGMQHMDHGVGLHGDRLDMHDPAIIAAGIVAADLAERAFRFAYIREDLSLHDHLCIRKSLDGNRLAAAQPCRLAQQIGRDCKLIHIDGAAELGVVAATKYAGCRPLLMVISSGSPFASARS